MYSKHRKMISTIKYLPLIYLNHKRQEIVSYCKKYFIIPHLPNYNKYSYIINKKYYEMTQKYIKK